jgi:hypothetical protein
MVNHSKLFQFAHLIHVAVLQPQAGRNRVGLGFFPFARHYLGNHCIVFSSSAYLDVSVQQVCVYYNPQADWVVPFGYYRIKTLLAVPRYFSQLNTSFIASETLGIHRSPLVTFLS